MQFILVVAVLVFAMPMTGFGWAEGSNVLLDPNLMCKKTRRLHGKLAEICRHDSALLKEIINGINLGFRECEFQFKNRRWNCTTLRKSMRKILMKDTRETGFVNAITAAGVTYAVTKACSMGNLVECSCDKNHHYVWDANAAIDGIIGDPIPTVPKRNSQIENVNNNRNGNNNNRNRNSNRTKGNRNNSERRRNQRILRNVVMPDGVWEWGGCGDNVKFGFQKSRDFLDAKYRKRSDIRTLVKLHNNKAGRLAVRDSMRLECKCHGLSGSCTVRTCWLKMPPFREVAAKLKDKFDGASRVISRNDGNSFMPEGPTIKRPGKYDLVYTDDSPDFCRPNYKTGSLGTVGRECNATSPGVDGCELLCCSRGYDHRIVRENVSCRCVFKWCCEVTCSKCIEKREINSCR